jgi:hypothetical protein
MAAAVMWDSVRQTRRVDSRTGKTNIHLKAQDIFNEKEDLEKQILVDLRQIQLSNMRLLAGPSQSFP